MKLLFVSSLLLFVSLASAKPAPYAKLFFDDGYVLTESDGATEILFHYGNYDQYDQGLFSVHFHGSTTRGSDSMYLKRELLKKVGAFAIEAFSGSDFNGADGRCKQNSSVQLRPLIENCENKILLRFLTDEERNEIELYKEDQILSEKPFEVIYDPKKVTTKSAKIAHLHYTDNSIWYYNDLYFNAAIRLEEDGHEVEIEHRRFDSFVIEGLPAESKEMCGKKGLDGVDLNLKSCKGRIQVGPK